ncbi:MAG: NTP transferase domain-containing protein [Acidimicrobiales bacterium]
MSRPLTVVVLAAGEGKRMGAGIPKPLRLVGGRPMICRVLDALAELGAPYPDLAEPYPDLGAPCPDLAEPCPDRAEPAREPGPEAGPLDVVVVVGHGAEQVRAVVADHAPHSLSLHFAEQSHRRGTGDAVTAAVAAEAQLFKRDGDVMVLPGDTPLLRSHTLSVLLRAHRDTGAAATVLVARPADPSGYGRVIRDEAGEVARIVEERDATGAEAATGEVNTSIYCFRAELLGPALAQLRPGNAAAELYLTDVVGILKAGGNAVGSVLVADSAEVAGVNDPAQLAAAEAHLRARTE